MKKVRYFRFALLLAFCFLFLGRTNIQAQNTFKEIDSFIEQEMRVWRIPNVSIGITNNDSIVFIKEYGSESVKAGASSQRAIHENYLLGSISKPFTAIAVMQLVEQGKLKLDQPVRNYLPWFETSNAALSARVTVRHLLNQTSGLPKNAGFFTPQSEQQSAIEEEYRSYLLSLSLNEAAIGTTHVYSNLNYQILGQLITKASGMRYADYVSTNIFTPCGMNNTFATYQQTQQHGLRAGYQYLFGFPIQSSFTYNNNGIAAGDIASNTEDMCKFLRVLLNNGKINGDSILSASTLQQMHQPFSNRYGMGFSIGDWNGLHSVRHSGLTRNYSATFNILPKQHYGIVILTNINSFSASRSLMDGVIRRLNNQEKKSSLPYEIYLRYGLLALLAWNVFEFVLRLNKWRKQGFAIHFATHFKAMLRLALNTVFALVWLIIVPIFAELPLSSMPAMQPDLGYGLIGGAIIGVCSAVIQHILHSQAPTSPAP